MSNLSECMVTELYATGSQLRCDKSDIRKVGIIAGLLCACSCTCLYFMDAQCIYRQLIYVHVQKCMFLVDYLSRVATSLRMIWLWGFICICHCRISWFMVHSKGEKGGKWEEMKSDDPDCIIMHIGIPCKDTHTGYVMTLCFIESTCNSFHCTRTTGLCNPCATFWHRGRPSC